MDFFKFKNKKVNETAEVQKEPAKMLRYVHTNIIPQNASKLIDFYKMVF